MLIMYNNNGIKLINRLKCSLNKLIINIISATITTMKKIP